ncbi:hypothetical protein L6164_005835 [Bauhinia variegata]|uniref:Uncharacterized protein n=1 Tax=Bauhinia variegata TaxID=167791 RepID=A0ACB9PV72_BAUVA|nr:hypothetical protein L6164_005835 [Bauhinia variegata]
MNGPLTTVPRRKMKTWAAISIPSFGSGSSFGSCSPSSWISEKSIPIPRKMVTVEEEDSSCSPFKSFARRCSRLVKEQRARFYILRRCVTMLICWQDCGDP